MSIDIEAMRAYQRRRREEQARAAREHAQQLWEKVPALVRFLKEHRGARRVWIFGSLANGTAGADSDIDLAVEGYDGKGYFSTVGELLGIANHKVDLVLLEEASESLRSRILAEGREI